MLKYRLILAPSRTHRPVFYPFLNSQPIQISIAKVHLFLIQFHQSEYVHWN